MGHTLTPNMNLLVPDDGDIQYEWADDINNIFIDIDNHNHNLSEKTGLNININNLNINDNFKFNNNSILSNLSNIGFQKNNENVIRNSLFTNGIDSFFYDGFGNKIQLTIGGNLNNLLTQGTIYGDYNTTTATVDYNGTGQVYTFKDSSGANTTIQVDTLMGSNLTITNSVTVSTLTTANSINISGLSDTVQRLITFDSSNNYSIVLQQDQNLFLKRDSNGTVPSSATAWMKFTDKLQFVYGDHVGGTTGLEPTYYNWFINTTTTTTNNPLTLDVDSSVDKNRYTPNAKLMFIGGNALQYTQFMGGLIGSFFNNDSSSIKSDDYFFTFSYGTSSSLTYVLYAKNTNNKTFPIALSMVGTYR